MIGRGQLGGRGREGDYPDICSHSTFAAPIRCRNVKMTQEEITVKRFTKDKSIILNELKGGREIILISAHTQNLLCT